MNTLTSFALSFSAALILTGCGGGGSSGGSSGSVAQLPEGKTLAFYNSQTGAQMVFDTTESKSVSLDENASSPLYMKDKEQGRLVYWPDEATGDAKLIMFKAAYDFERDGNVSFEDFIYLGHFHGTELAAHAASEFDPAVASAIKLATLDRLSAYLQEQSEIKEEIEAAMLAQNEELCTFYVPQHAHEENATEAHKPLHFAISKSAKLYILEEGEAGLVPLQGQVVVALEGATTCNADESGITGYGEEGILLFLAQTQTLYLVDSHGLDYHQHSRWKLEEFLPKGFSAMQMAGLGEGGHDDHAY